MLMAIDVVAAYAYGTSIWHVPIIHFISMMRLLSILLAVSLVKSDVWRGLTHCHGAAVVGGDFLLHLKQKSVVASIASDIHWRHISHTQVDRLVHNSRGHSLSCAFAVNQTSMVNAMLSLRKPNASLFKIKI
jgi:hypothetical protein